MLGNMNNDLMLDMYIFETTQLLEQLEQLVIDEEKTNNLPKSINEIFRIMHTIKGSSAMMSYNNISELSHSIEDLFYYLREKKPEDVDNNSIGDIILDAVDFIRNELSKIESGNKPDGDSTKKIDAIKTFLYTLKGLSDTHNEISKVNYKANDNSAQNISMNSNKKDKDNFNKQKYQALMFFEEGCEMENIRAYVVINKLSEIAEITSYCPENLLEDDNAALAKIRKKGFTIIFYSSLDTDTMREKLEETIFMDKLELTTLNDCEDIQINQNGMNDINLDQRNPTNEKTEYQKSLNDQRNINSPQNQGIISVSLTKTDRLMDLIGELVIAEAMVTQNPELAGLKLGNFQKAARQLTKITSELQDVAMSIRMVSLFSTFNKMQRIVRDMSKKMNKDVLLEIIGEETEVDKNIIDHISDPLMHIVRNAIDHGIEDVEDRLAMGKPQAGKVTLEARNAGSDVLVIIKDDGAGLNKEKIIQTAREHGLISKSETEMTENDIFKLIFVPGFSTNSDITEYSGRGVGMDVVSKNIESVGGYVSVDSVEGTGTIVTLKIPLTLAIIDGMNVRVGNSRYTIPITSIKESFRPQKNDIIRDPDENEMIMVRGQCYRILRLHEFFGVKTDTIHLEEGILIMLEQNQKSLCIFVDELLGQQQVVVKALPSYIKSKRKIGGLGGCTLLGDGSISLILNIEGLLNKP